MNCENKGRSIIYQKNYIMLVLLSEVKLWQRVPMTVQLMESESKLRNRDSTQKCWCIQVLFLRHKQCSVSTFICRNTKFKEDPWSSTNQTLAGMVAHKSFITFWKPNTKSYKIEILCSFSCISQNFRMSFVISQPHLCNGRTTERKTNSKLWE